MEAFKNEVDRITEDVMQHMDILQGTEFSECINDVRLELTNRLGDLISMVHEKNEIQVNPKAVVTTYFLDGKNYRVCHVTAMVAGEGNRAFGGVGVAWAEEIPYNTAMRVATNTVNKRTAELWGIVVAAKVALTRNYQHIMIASQNFTYTRRLIQELRAGNLDNTECSILAAKIREYEGTGLEIRIPDEVEDAVVKSSGKAIMTKSKKLAKEAFLEAKRNLDS